MARFLLVTLLFIFSIAALAQNTASSTSTQSSTVKRPKLVVGIVVDQMRWDYLYRYTNRYAENGGFKRLLSQGFSCENTMIPYTPTVTACGHASIYTGSVPAINGISGNDWWDYNQNKFVYCTEDTVVQTVGSNTALGQMSPKNLLATTIGDELKLATNFRSKVIGIAIKDRGAILPAGHSADAAYWFDNKTGDWITSSYYVNDLPGWAKDVNAKKLVDKYYALDWPLLYAADSYEQSAPGRKGFPRDTKQYIGKNYSVIAAIPYGNTFTFDMAKAAIIGEKMGVSANTDMIAISLSTPDYIGHAYGPNSVEQEDCFLRLDKDLGEFLDFLDEKVGKGNSLVFLTADHGVANMPAFLNEHKIPAGNFDSQKVEEQLSSYLKKKYDGSNLVTGILNYQVYLDRNVMAENKINKDAVYADVIAYLTKNSSIDRVFALDAVNQTTLQPTIKEVLINGYYPSRSGDIQIVLRPQFIDGFLKGGSTHGVWNPYDAHIPLVWYGWNVKQGKTHRETYMTDIAATIAAMLNIQMPSGCVGHVIEETISR